MSEEMKNDIEETKVEAAEVAEQTAAEGEKTADVVSKKKKGPVIAVIATVAFLVVLVGAILAVLFATGKLGNGGKNKQNMSDKYLTDTDYDTTTLAYEELLQIVEKALNDGDYDKAIENYEKALEANDMSVDAYLGLVEAYIRKGDFDKALEIAKKGYEKTGDQRLQEKIDMIESGNIVDARGLVYKKTMYDANNQIMYWQEFTYDENGDEKSVTSYDANGNQTGHVDCDHSNPSRVVSFCTYSETGKVFKSVSEYDSSGALIKSTYYGGETEADGWYIIYDHDGEKNIQTQYGMDGKVQTRYIDYQDGSKYVTEFYHYEEWHDTFVLDSKQVNDGNFTYHYDANGNMTYYSETQYDDNGNAIGYTEYNPDGSVIRYEVYE